jgi:WD40 repeat protein
VVSGRLLSRFPHSALSPALTTLEQSVLASDAYPASQACFSPDGRYLATGAVDGKIRVCSSADKSFTHPLIDTLFVSSPAHLSPATCIHHPQIWNIATERILSIFEGHEDSLISLDFSPDGRLIISASYDNPVRIWDMESKQHEMLSITAGVDVRVIVTYHRVWHANARCLYGRR